jgi:phytoene dehydrogenase-like protein
MHMNQRYDAVIIGSGPNGLAAAIRLAQAGKRIVVYEARATIGGGARSAQVTLPGFIHDICSAIHPLAMSSPFFSSLPLEQYGLEWITPLAAVAHPLDDEPAVIVTKDVEATAARLGEDARTYRRLIGPLVARWPQIAPTILGPLRPSWQIEPLARFGISALRSAQRLTKQSFQTQRARALFGGLSSHSMLPLDALPTAAFGLTLGISTHTTGWPFPKGGAQRIADALASYFLSLGGTVVTETPIASLDDLPLAYAYIFDITPRQLDQIAGHRLSACYRRGLARYRYGPGVFKLDFALDGPVPWRDSACLQAGTLHLGGKFTEIAASESAVWHGIIPEQPFVLVAQHTIFDPSRAPAGQHTLWAYCHVPFGSTEDMTERIVGQIERFAPGFRQHILASHKMNTADMEAYNANYIGGDINGGTQDITQLFTRPMPRINPYTTSDPTIFICSSATPPGGGVHGMCGYHAAEAVLRRLNN